MLIEPDGRWGALYEEDAAAIDAALGPLVLGMEHIGSTAIPGIKAKPIIDIMVGVRRLEDGLSCIAPMAGIGYDYVGLDLVPNDHIFGKGVARTNLVHVVEHGGYHWTRNLRFRDALRADPALALAYEELKVGLAAKFADQRASYTAAKKEFIDRIADV
jgi:GrpB-like predicted nucleotidyltransferase (UPF0157 family)